MRTPIPVALAAILSACTPPAPAESIGRTISVEIRSEGGRSLPLYPAACRSGASRVYAEARLGEGYAIHIRNNTGRRVGVVIAVDGRNIISGAKSWLGHRERMYILEPYGSQEYAGWRTAQDRIHRFYFTSPSDSYAGASGDESAMGIIAVAAYAESRPHEPPRIARERSEAAPSCPSTPGAAPQESRKAEAPRLDLESQAGTGYGAEDYSPSYTVSFTPEPTPREKVLIKYEWRETLLRLGVIPRHRPESPRNRLWDEGYAPPPPRW